MALSMTGYGRAKAVLNGRDITVEIKSVNSRYFEYSSRLPRSCAFLDDSLKKMLGASISRGKVELSLQMQSSLPTPRRRSRKLLLRARLAGTHLPKPRLSPCPRRKRWNRLHRPSTMRLPPSGVPFRMLLRSRTTRPDDLKYPLRKLRTL